MLGINDTRVCDKLIIIPVFILKQLFNKIVNVMYD